MSGVSISQITTVGQPFADDLDAYRAAAADGIGIWELKLPEGSDTEALAQSSDFVRKTDFHCVKSVARVFDHLRRAK